MLYKYRDEYNKIVLGMLSLSKNSDKMNYMLEELDWYNDRSNRLIYLWKDQYNNWAGIIGVEENKTNVVIRRIIMTPDADNYFNIFKLLDALQKEYPNKKIMGSLMLKKLIAKWELSNDQRRFTNTH